MFNGIRRSASHQREDSVDVEDFVLATLKIRIEVHLDGRGNCAELMQKCAELTRIGAKVRKMCMIELSFATFQF